MSMNFIQVNELYETQNNMLYDMMNTRHKSQNSSYSQVLFQVNFR